MIIWYIADLFCYPEASLYETLVAIRNEDENSMAYLVPIQPISLLSSRNCECSVEERQPDDELCERLQLMSVS